MVPSSSLILINSSSEIRRDWRCVAADLATLRYPCISIAGFTAPLSRGLVGNLGGDAGCGSAAAFGADVLAARKPAANTSAIPRYFTASLLFQGIQSLGLMRNGCASHSHHEL